MGETTQVVLRWIIWRDIMAVTTEISWTDSTWNPWIGCTKVSSACDNCYAESLSNRHKWTTWGPRGDRHLTKTWGEPLKWQRKAAEFQIAHGHRQRVFCASLADVFDNHKSILPEWRIELFDLVRRTPDLDWQFLTKRPQNIAKMIPPSWDDHFPSNVWIGTTTENQEEFDRRWPHIARLPAAVRFISYEPALGPLELPKERGPSWVICGGESGPGARPMSIQWAREARDQCAAAGIAYFFKQWGGWRPAGLHRAGHPGRFAFGDYEYDRARMIQIDHYPRQFTMFGARSVMELVGKKASGRLLDGVEHNRMPIYDRRIP
jgi:protein gp37